MTNLPVSGKFRITCPFNKKGNTWLAGFHTGLDIVSDNDFIFGTGEGKVVKIGYDGAYGNYVVVKIGERYHWFCHLKSIRCELNQNVTRGTILGIMGNTGNSTGKHLHWEIRKECNCYGKVENPADYAGIPNKLGLYDSTNYHINKYKNGDIIRIKGLDTGAVNDNKCLVEIPIIKEQIWCNMEDFNYMVNELKVIVCASANNHILVEVKGVKQFWIDEKDVIK